MSCVVAWVMRCERGRRRERVASQSPVHKDHVSSRRQSQAPLMLLACFIAVTCCTMLAQPGGSSPIVPQHAALRDPADHHGTLSSSHADGAADDLAGKIRRESKEYGQAQTLSHGRGGAWRARQPLAKFSAGFMLGGEEPAKPERPVGPEPTLVVFCFTFNRPKNFMRLWEAIKHAKPSGLRTRLVIHVDFDASGSAAWREQVRIAHELSGSHTVHGVVSAVFATSPRGLRATMLEAWAPTDGEYAMFLEDDIEVSEMLFVYAERFILAYGEGGERDASVLGYKMYNQKWDEVNQRFEVGVENGHAPFKIQEPCSWGTVFVAGPYRRYLEWFTHNAQLDPMIPHAWSNTWNAERSAKKYLQRFMWETGTYLISINFPDHLSLTSARVEVGTNIRAMWVPFLAARLEVPLLTRETEEEYKGRLLVDSDGGSKSLVIVDTVHSVVGETVLPTEEELASVTFVNNPPPDSILNSLHYSASVTSRLVAKAKDDLLTHYQQYPLHALSRESLTPFHAKALRELLTKRQFPQQVVLPNSVVAAVDSAHSLYALGAMFLAAVGQKSLFVYVQYGLTNRLRAYASARAMARLQARQLVVLWIEDGHCLASFDELFDVPKDVVVIDDPSVFEVFAHIESVISMHDLMNKEEKTASVSLDHNKHVVIRSAFRINSNPKYYQWDLLPMRALFARPALPVETILTAYYASLPKSPRNLAPRAFHQSFVGVHIRMMADMHSDTPGVTGEELVRMHLASAFRVSCHYRHFLPHMASFPASTHFFISTDTPEAFDAIAAMPAFAGRVHRVDTGGCTSRSTECMHYAAADLLLLAATQEAFLASRWSAFSEAAVRVGGMKQVQACDEPRGGWKFGAGSKAVADQIVSYLEHENYSDIDVVKKALKEFM